MDDIELSAQATVLPVLRIVQPNDSYLDSGDVLVRIERDPDGSVYDANNTDPKQRTFKPDAQCQNPWIPLVQGAGNSSGRLESTVSLDPTVFTDGDYVVNFHDGRFPTRTVFGMDYIYVYDGKVSTPRPFHDWEIANRVIECTMAAHKTPGTLGAIINTMAAQIVQIQQQVAQLVAALPPK